MYYGAVIKMSGSYNIIDSSITMLGQLDELINKQLGEQVTPINFKVVGASNGLILENLFPYQVMVYINAVVVQDRLAYDLNIVNLDVKRDKEGNAAKAKSVTRAPLVYSGMLGKMNVEKIADLTQVEINMQQAPKEDTILAIKISLTYKNNTKSRDSLSLLVLNPEELQKPKIESLNLLRFRCKDDHILDFMWHPLSGLTLLTLLDNETIEVWNLREEDFMKPTSIFKLKNHKNSYSMALDIKFTSFAALPGQPNPNISYGKVEYNRYTLFVMNSIGDITSIFPFIPSGCQLTRQEYDNIYKSQQLKTKQINLLYSYLTQCELQRNEDEQNYLIVSTSRAQNHTQVQRWLTNSLRKTKINQISKIFKEESFYSLRLCPIHEDYVLVVQVMHRNAAKCNCIWVGVISKQLEVAAGRDRTGELQADNVLYEIVEIRNEIQNKDSDLRFVSSDPRMYETGLDQYRALFYVEQNGLYKLDLSSVYKFLESNQMKQLQGENAFQTTLIFQLPSNESIVALACESKLNTVTFVRRTANKIKFELQSLDYLNTFSEVQQISRSSTQLLAKLNNLKIEYSRKPLTKEQEKNSQLSIGADRLKVYEEKGIEEFKKDYKIYCENVKNSIDQSMSKLKASYELMRKKLRSFSQFKDKKRQLNTLLEEVQENNKQINRLLFEERKKQKNELTGQLVELQHSIHSMKSILDTAKGKKLSLNPQSTNSMIKEIDGLFDRLKSTRSNIDEAKEYKKECEEHSNG